MLTFKKFSTIILSNGFFLMIIFYMLALFFIYQIYSSLEIYQIYVIWNEFMH